MSDKSMTQKIALCGVFAALCLVFLWIGGMTLLDLSVLVVCSLMTMLIVIETGVKTAWVYAAATSALAFLLLPSKLYAVEYTLFAAVYPIMKLYFERLRPLIAWQPLCDLHRYKNCRSGNLLYMKRDRPMLIYSQSHIRLFQTDMLWPMQYE